MGSIIHDLFMLCCLGPVVQQLDARACWDSSTLKSSEQGCALGSGLVAMESSKPMMPPENRQQTASGSAGSGSYTRSSAMNGR